VLPLLITSANGKFYASKTFFDDKQQRRILWGWLNESDSSADDVAKGWSGIQVCDHLCAEDLIQKGRCTQDSSK